MGKVPHKPQSSSVTAEQRAAMVALAEILRDIFSRQQKSAASIIDSALTPSGKLLLQ